MTARMYTDAECQGLLPLLAKATSGEFFILMDVHLSAQHCFAIEAAGFEIFYARANGGEQQFHLLARSVDHERALDTVQAIITEVGGENIVIRREMIN